MLDMKHIHNLLLTRAPQMLDQEKWRKYAIMVPIIIVHGKAHILFEQRTQGLRRQPGDICFPGGRVEEDDQNEQHAAVRETCEELGIGEKHIQVLGELDHLVTSFGMIIYPFVGQIDPQAKQDPNSNEVDEVFSVPLSFFMSYTPEVHHVDLVVKPREGFPYEHIANGRNYKWSRGSIPEYFYFHEDKVIWGLTARILHHFIDLNRS